MPNGFALSAAIVLSVIAILAARKVVTEVSAGLP